MFRVGLVAALAILVSSQTYAGHLERGNAAYNKGDYAEAEKQWNEAALSGNPAAEYNLGIIWENGLGSTQRSVSVASTWYLQAANQGFLPAMNALARLQLAEGQTTAAVSWLTLAARWNDQSAISSLVSLGQPVPAADLYAQRQQVDAQQQAAYASMGYAVGCIIGGGCAPPSPGLYAVPPPVPPRTTIDLRCRPEGNGSLSVTYRCKN